MPRCLRQINDLGFDADLWKEDDTNLQGEYLKRAERRWARRAAEAVALAVPVVALAMVSMLPGMFVLGCLGAYFCHTFLLLR